MTEARTFSEAVARELRARLLRHAIGAAIWLALAGLCALGAGHAYTMQQSGAVRWTYARVLAIETPYGDGREFLVSEFVTERGETRRLRNGRWYAPNARVGDVIPYLYSLDEPSFTRPVNAGERFMRGFFIWMAIGLVLGAGLWFGIEVRRALYRRRLVRDGRAISVWRSTIETSIAPLVRPPQPRWRLRAQWFDQLDAQWRECVSDWQPGAAPRSLAEPVLVFVDPQRPQRTWLPGAASRGASSSSPASLV
jgi:hypothetical protein